MYRLLFFLFDGRERQPGKLHQTPDTPHILPFALIHFLRFFSILIYRVSRAFFAMQTQPVPVGILYRALDVEEIRSPGQRLYTIARVRTAQGLGEQRADGERICVLLLQAHQVAHQQVYAQRAPAVALDARIDIISLSPLIPYDRAAVFACHAWQAAVCVRFATIGAAIGGVDKAVGEFGCLLDHPGGVGGADQRHHHWRPAQRRPLAAVAWWFREGRAQVRDLLAPGGLAEERARCMASRSLDQAPATES